MHGVQIFDFDFASISNYFVLDGFGQSSVKTLRVRCAYTNNAFMERHLQLLNNYYCSFILRVERRKVVNEIVNDYQACDNGREYWMYADIPRITEGAKRHETNIEPVRTRVAVIRCDDYDYSAVKRSVARGIEFIGGCPGLIKPGEKILLSLIFWPLILVPRNVSRLRIQSGGRSVNGERGVAKLRSFTGYGQFRTGGAKSWDPSAVGEELGLNMADLENHEVAFLEGIQIRNLLRDSESSSE